MKMYLRPKNSSSCESGFYRLYLIFLLLAFLSCDKSESDEFIFDECSYDFGSCAIVESGVSDLTFYDPIFTSNTEIAFFRRDNSAGNTLFVSRNIFSNSESVISDQLTSVGKMDYENGWFYFSTNDWKIVKFNRNTKEMVQISYAPRDLAPRINKSRNVLSYSQAYLFSSQELIDNPELEELYKMKLKNLSTPDVDSFCSNYPEGVCRLWDDNYDWISDSTFVAIHRTTDYSEYGLSVYDKNGNHLNRIVEIRPESTIQFLTSDHLGQNIYFLSNDGINELNLVSKNIKIIKLSCRNRYYSSLDISPDGRYLVAHVKEVGILSACEAIVRNFIVLISIKSGIEIPIVE